MDKKHLDRTLFLWHPSIKIYTEPTIIYEFTNNFTHIWFIIYLLQKFGSPTVQSRFFLSTIWNSTKSEFRQQNQSDYSNGYNQRKMLILTINLITSSVQLRSARFWFWFLGFPVPRFPGSPVPQLPCSPHYLFPVSFFLIPVSSFV